MSAKNILERARGLEPMTISLRREFHTYPELNFREVRTANRVAEELRKMGLEVETGVGTTGVVARIGEATVGALSIGIRGDMDALPITESRCAHGDFAHRRQDAHRNAQSSGGRNPLVVPTLRGKLRG